MSFTQSGCRSLRNHCGVKPDRIGKKNPLKNDVSPSCVQCRSVSCETRREFEGKTGKKKRRKKLGEQSGAGMERMESSEGGMSEGMSQEGKAEAEGKQETLWGDKERLVM